MTLLFDIISAWFVVLVIIAFIIWLVHFYAEYVKLSDIISDIIGTALLGLVCYIVFKLFTNGIRVIYSWII